MNNKYSNLVDEVFQEASNHNEHKDFKTQSCEYIDNIKSLSKGKIFLYKLIVLIVIMFVVIGVYYII